MKILVDGGYGSWSNWTQCSVTCGVGHRTRHRECDSPEPQFGGLNCVEAGLGPENETVSCDMGSCAGELISSCYWINRLASPRTRR